MMKKLTSIIAACTVYLSGCATPPTINSSRDAESLAQTAYSHVQTRPQESHEQLWLDIGQTSRLGLAEDRSEQGITGRIVLNAETDNTIYEDHDEDGTLDKYFSMQGTTIESRKGDLITQQDQESYENLLSRVNGLLSRR